MTSISHAQTLNDQERIVFLGDSITQAGAQPGGYVSMIRQQIESKLGDKDIEVIGAGISGNKVPDLQRRLKTDVLDKKPTLVVIYIGINDVWHSESGKGTSKPDFKAGLLDIIEQIQSAGARVVLCTPSVIGEKRDGSNKLDSMLEEYSQISRDIATEKGCQLLDLRKKFLDFLKANNKDNQVSNVLTTDGVHLNAKGNKFVAMQMLNALRVLPTTTGNPSDNRSGKVLRHIVLFKFKEGLEEAEINAVVDGFVDLEDKIEAVDAFEHGTDVSRENLSQGFTHCFVVTFNSVDDRETYLQHPAHQAFVKFLDGKVDEALVVDFWAEK